ncbi:hypothetical protein NHQ30_011351 [Ciborinia camelliae]|nr:hypothetical protein NHQ30_011351 [Ciborinia camelliae]
MATWLDDGTTATPYNILERRLLSFPPFPPRSPAAAFAEFNYLPVTWERHMTSHDHGNTARSAAQEYEEWDCHVRQHFNQHVRGGSIPSLRPYEFKAQQTQRGPNTGEGREDSCVPPQHLPGSGFRQATSGYLAEKGN